MFMDPSAFEAEDIERELADAGLAPPETKTNASSTFHPGDGYENPLRGPDRGGDRLPPSSGSSLAGHANNANHGGSSGGNYGGNRSGSYGGNVIGSYSGSGYRGEGGDAGGKLLQPKAMAEDRGLPAPTYGRHSKGGGNGGNVIGRRSKARPEIAPPSSTPPQSNSPTPLTSSHGPFSEVSVGSRPESQSFGSGGGGGEEKFGENSPERFSNTMSSTGGAGSRARVLAQQREIQRKRRQQALSAGGIRASDAASLNRGLVSSSPSVPSRSRGVFPGQGTGDGGHDAEGTIDGEGGGDGVEGDSQSFSPSVKQFSAPRKVEGDEYTAFNLNPRNAGERSSENMSEFDRSRVTGVAGGLLSDSDEYDDGGGRGSRRSKSKLAPDMAPRAAEDFEASSSRSPIPGHQSARGRKPGHPRGGEGRRPEDWDDRDRPSTTTYKWEQGGAGGEDDNADDGDTNSPDRGDNAWRSVGRDSSPASTKLPRQSSRSSKHSPRHSPGRSLDRSPDRPPDRSSEERSSNRSSSSSSSSRSRSPPGRGAHGVSGHRGKTRSRGSGGRGRGRGDGNKSPTEFPTNTKPRGKVRAGGASGPHAANDGGRGGRGGGGSDRRRGEKSGSARGSAGGRGKRASEVGRGSGSGSDKEPRRRDRSESDDESVVTDSSGSTSSRGKDKRGGRRGADSESDSPRDSDGGRQRRLRERSSRRRQRYRSSRDARNPGRGDSDPSSSDFNHRAGDNDQRRDRLRPSPGRPRGKRGSEDTNSSDGRRTSRKDKQQQKQHRRGERSSGGDGDRAKRNSEKGSRSGDDDGQAGKGSNKSRDEEGRHRSQDNSRGPDKGGGREDRNKRADNHHDEEESKSDARDGKGSAAGSRDFAARDGVTADPSAVANTTESGETEFNMDAIDLSDMKKFLLSPCPRAAGTVQCYIRRNKTRANKLFPEYSLFMKEGDRFLMCSKKRPNNATSNYLVSMRAGDLDRSSKNFLGKLRANFVGTEFQVYDDGYNPREQGGTFGLSKSLGGGSGSWGGGNSNGPMREELGCVMYASNVLGSRGPRKMQVAIPAVSDDGVVTKWSELDGGRGSVAGGSGGSKAIERVKNRDYDGSLYMVNKPPRWNDQVGAYVLNFYGRVTMASVKNFQLVSTEDFDRIILQFGRVAKDEFTMDFQYPISPFQAFAITLSSFDSKIACD